MPNWKKLVVSGSDASLASLNISGNLTASAAYLESASIGHLETIYETASVIYSSGSTKFGDTSDDTHEYTGSVSVSGSISIVEGGSLIGTASIADFATTSSYISTASFANSATTASQADNATSSSIADELSGLATASFAITASHALNVPDTASHALTAVTSSHTTGTASFANTATTSSYTLTGDGTFSGSFSGSFEGDGSGLTGIIVAESTLVEDTFTSATSVTSSHNFETKNINVTVYDDNDEVLLPETIRTLDINNVGIDFATSTTGRIIITKGGHIVSGSIENATSASFAATASLAETASYFGGTVTSASFAETASFYGGSVTSASLAETASYYGGSVTSASLAETASFVETSQTASHALVTSQSVNNNTASGSLSFWNGSQTEYDSLGSYDNNTIYFVT